MSIAIGILVFPQVQQLDYVAPYEVFAALPGTTQHLIWRDLQPVRSSTGLVTQPTVTFDEWAGDNGPPLDVLCVPGGAGVNPLLTDRAVLDFVRRAAAGARFVTSVCTGSLVLGAAGLLQGKRATTHWNALDFLPAFGAVPTAGRVVRDGNLITAGGVTAGIDFALSVIAELAGETEAQTVQLALEYAPEPPFHSGTPEQAPAAVLGIARQRIAASRRQREEILAQMVPA